jgi:hypothetical protein
MRRTSPRSTLARGGDRAHHATESTDGPSQDDAHFRASDTGTAADPTVAGRELDNRRMYDPAGSPGKMTRGERRGTHQTYGKR